MDGQMDRWIGGWVVEWVGERRRDRLKEWASQRKNQINFQYPHEK